MSDESRIRKLIARWEQARKQAPHQPPLTAEELCYDAPDLLPHIKAHLRQLQSPDSSSETVPDPDEAQRHAPTESTTLGGDDARSHRTPLPIVPGYELIEEIGR